MASVPTRPALRGCCSGRSSGGGPGEGNTKPGAKVVGGSVVRLTALQ